MNIAHLNYENENNLIREMMTQGEFCCLVESSKNGEPYFIVQWWCRKTDNLYESAASTLFDALASVLGQAKSDPNPSVTEEQLRESAEKYKIEIYLPSADPYRPLHEDR